MLRPVAIVFLLTWTGVFGESCVKYNFDNDYENLFHNNATVCTGINSWQLRKYSSTGVTDPPNGSDNFIEPIGLSCSSSFLFNMDGGVLEVNVYMKSKSDRDQVTVFVHELLDAGTDPILATATIQPMSPTYKEGWNIMQINVPRPFTGYLTFFGMKNEGSVVLIDSFRFYKSSYENDCRFYESETNATPSSSEEMEYTTETTINGEYETTAILEDLTTQPNNEFETTPFPDAVATTNSEPEHTTTYSPLPEAIPTTELPERLEECVTYNFDKDFDSLFTNEHRLCTGFNTWTLSDYSDSGIDSENARGNSYLRPNEDLSCISAFPIPMSPNGTVEVNVYVDPVTPLDHIIVLVKHIVEGGRDTVAGFTIYEPSISSFVKGWNILRVNVNTLRSFDGYLLFLGIASEGATVLVDSFRYIPPTMSGDEESCAY